MHTEANDLAVWCTPRRLTRQCDAHRGDWLGSVMHTAEIDSTVWCTPRRWTRQCDALEQLTPQYDAQSGVWLSSLMHTVVTERCDAHRWDWPHGGMQTVEFLKNSNILAKSEKKAKIPYIVCLSGAQMGLNHETLEFTNLIAHFLYSKTIVASV